MGGPSAPELWKGKISGINYNIGGSWLPNFEGWKAKISTHNWEKTTKTANVIGYIKGAVEPDR